MEAGIHKPSFSKDWLSVAEVNMEEGTQTVVNRAEGGRERGGRWLSQFGLVKKAVVRISIDDDKWKDVWGPGPMQRWTLRMS